MNQLKRLDQLPLEQSAEIVAIETDEDIKRRLMDLGMIYGTLVKSVLVSPAGDPVAYEVRGATVALRKRISSLIVVKEVEST